MQGMVQYIHHTEQSRGIEVKDLSFKYRNSPEFALKNLTLNVNPGEFIVFMGQTGAGKSTLAKCLTSIIPKFQKGNFSGEIKIFGKNIKDNYVYETAENIGLLLQDFEIQLFSTNVTLEVAFGPENFALPREEIEKRVKQSLSMVGLNGFETRDPATLSGGEKQRLALASILSLQPKILILDEPSTDLDPKGKRELFELVKLLIKQEFTVIVIEHETEELFNANRVVVLNQGKIITQGEPEKIFSNTKVLEDNGIRPPQVFDLFRKLNLDYFPSSVEEAYTILRRNSYQISENRYNSLLERESSQRNKYQKVLIETKNSGFVYPDGKQVLKGINLQIREGEFLAIVGENGSGKTTLVKQFNGLLKPSEGEIFYQNTNIRKLKIVKLARDIGYVFQNPDNQIFSSTVKEEVSFGLKNLYPQETETEQKVKKVLEDVHLQGYEEKDPFILTKGEKQRLAVASVLVTEPKVIILDEPTTGLDYGELQSLMHLLKELNQRGHTIIMVTHTMWLVAEYAYRVVILKKGGIIFDGTPRELFEQENLENYGLQTPPLIQLSKHFSKVLLSVEEVLSSLVTNKHE